MPTLDLLSYVDYSPVIDFTTVADCGPDRQYGRTVSRDTHDLSGAPPARRERADAARNRAAILAACERLFAEHGVAAVSMDAVAAEAGVGKGTLFRRFGDKSGLAAALLDERERELQERMLHGPPPLGPGAQPADRLVAFIDAYLSYAYPHLDLIRMSETATPGARYRIGAYRLWHRHLSFLLAAADPAVDADTSAHLVLAGLSGELLAALTEAGIGRDRVRACMVDLVRRLTAGRPER
jgi:AcrR family transcriptional regulator